MHFECGVWDVALGLSAIFLHEVLAVRAELSFASPFYFLRLLEFEDRALPSGGWSMSPTTEREARYLARQARLRQLEEEAQVSAAESRASGSPECRNDFPAKGNSSSSASTSRSTPLKAESSAPTPSPTNELEKTHAEVPTTGLEKTHAEAQSTELEKTHAEAPSTELEKTHAEAPATELEKTHAEAPATEHEKTHAETPKAELEKTHAETPKAALEKTHAETPKPELEKTHAETPKAELEKTAAVVEFEKLRQSGEESSLDSAPTQCSPSDEREATALLAVHQEESPLPPQVSSEAVEEHADSEECSSIEIDGVDLAPEESDAKEEALDQDSRAQTATDAAFSERPQLKGTALHSHGRQSWREKSQCSSFGRLRLGNAAAGGARSDGSVSAANAGKKRWLENQKRKAQLQALRASEREAKAVKEKIRIRRRQQREAKRQRRIENEMKSAKVQVIKDTTKINKWSKQARRQLVKMSPEMIKQLYGVQL